MITDFFLTMPFAEATGVYYAFIHSDKVGQGIVLMLLVFSVITWCLMLIKGMGLAQAYKDSRRLLDELRKKKNPLQLKTIMDREEAPVAKVFQACYARAATVLNSEDLIAGQRKAFTDPEIKVMRSAMEEAVADQIVILEDKIVLLMTAVSISPFLGLFGTVWGIMLAFTEMAIQGKPDVATLAPGVSGALLTTVLGLIVAIPSLIGYNTIGFYIKQITVFMDNFVEETLAKFEVEQIQMQAAEKRAAQQPVQQGYNPQNYQQQNYQQPVQQGYNSQNYQQQNYQQQNYQTQNYQQRPYGGNSQEM